MSSKSVFKIIAYAFFHSINTAPLNAHHSSWHFPFWHLKQCIKHSHLIIYSINNFKCKNYICTEIKCSLKDKLTDCAVTSLKRKYFITLKILSQTGDKFIWMEIKCSLKDKLHVCHYKLKTKPDFYHFKTLSEIRP